MNCVEFRDKVYLYIDNELTDDMAKEFEEHAAKCADCRLFLSEIQKTRQAVKELKDINPPDYLKETILNRIKVERQKESRVVRFPLRKYIAAAASVIFVIAAVGVVNHFYKRGDEYRNISPQNELLISGPAPTQGGNKGMPETGSYTGGIPKDNSGADDMFSQAPSSVISGPAAPNVPQTDYSGMVINRLVLKYDSRYENPDDILKEAQSLNILYSAESSGNNYSLYFTNSAGRNNLYELLKYIEGHYSVNIINEKGDSAVPEKSSDFIVIVN